MRHGAGSGKSRTAPPGRLPAPALLSALTLLAAAGARGAGTGSWRQLSLGAVRPLARSGHTLSSFSGGAYLYGGQTVSPTQGTVRLTDLWAFNAGGPPVRVNSTTPDPPPRDLHAAVVAGSDLYVFFGRAQDGSVRSDLWRYHRIESCWEFPPTTTAPPPARLLASAVATRDGQILLFGGESDAAGSALFDDLWSYNPISGVWRQKASCPGGGRAGHAAALLGGKLIVLGGATAEGASSDAWAYDPAANTWASLPEDGDVPPPFASAAAAAGEFSGNGTQEIVLTGLRGQDGSESGATYAVTVDALGAHWSRRADGPAFSHGAAALLPAATGDLLLRFGGEQAGRALGDAWLYSEPPPAPSPDLTGAWGRLVRTRSGSGSRARVAVSGTFRVRNAGTAACARSVVGFYLSSSAVRDGSSRLLKRVSLPALRAGVSRAVALRAALPRGQNGRGGYLLAVVDLNGQVPEADESNNVVAAGPLR